MSSLCWEGVWEGVLLSTAAFRARISCSIPERVMCWAQGLLSGGAQMALGRLSACSRSEGTVPWAPRSRSLLPASSQPRAARESQVPGSSPRGFAFPVGRDPPWLRARSGSQPSQPGVCCSALALRWALKQWPRPLLSWCRVVLPLPENKTKEPSRVHLK